ncbi:MAG: phenylalanine--tRNA ligase subunit beta [Candidatus Omnitrophota bacterium]
MKITYSWIKEYLHIKTTPQVLADRLSMAGLSVAALEAFRDDWVYDIEVTSNRPDWLSVRGIVREVAAVTGAKFKPRFFEKPEKYIPGNAKGLFDVMIEDKKGCSFYGAGLLKNVLVGNSPDWLKRRLESVGLRPVNNVVDITNYLMLEYGQPLHAFDFDKIKGSNIIIRRAKPDEQIDLLDGSCKKLCPDVLVIADLKTPLAVAGIMGGRDSQVTAETTNVLIESAYFDPCCVRAGSRLLGVASDSSYRFERGADRQDVYAALLRACNMTVQICKGEAPAVKTKGLSLAKKSGTGVKRVKFSLKKAMDILGINVSAKESSRILKDLGFSMKAKSKDIFEVGVPSFRRDVAISEDIAEEIARVYGYDRIPTTQLPIEPCFVPVPKELCVKKHLEQVMMQMGFKEVVTYGLLGQDDYRKSAVKVAEDTLSLKNALSQDNSILRTTLFPGLLKCAAYNVNYGNKNLEIFEAARVFCGNKECLSLGLVLSGARRKSWRAESAAYSLFDLKGALETIASEFCLEGIAIEPNNDMMIFENGMSFQMKAQGKVIACFGKVARYVKKAWEIKIKDDVFAGELDIEALAVLAKIKKVFKPFTIMPSIIRDLSLIVPGDEVSFEQIAQLIRSSGRGYVYDVVMVEIYQGKEIPAGGRGLTISVEYRCFEKTLTDAEINPVHTQIVERLKQDFSITLR